MNRMERKDRMVDFRQKDGKGIYYRLPKSLIPDSSDFGRLTDALFGTGVAATD